MRINGATADSPSFISSINNCLAACPSNHNAPDRHGFFAEMDFIGDILRRSLEEVAMEKGYENLTIAASRIGKFGGYEMFGLLHKNAAGEHGWLVTAWLAGSDPMQTFWVEKGKFVSARGHWVVNFPEHGMIEMLPGDTEIKPEMRNAILQGIAEWEKTASSA